MEEKKEEEDKVLKWALWYHESR